MVMYYMKWMTATCLPMIGHLYDAILMVPFILQNITVRKVLETVASLHLKLLCCQKDRPSKANIKLMVPVQP